MVQALCTWCQAVPWDCRIVAAACGTFAEDAAVWAACTSVGRCGAVVRRSQAQESVIAALIAAGAAEYVAVV
jgi:hypothetical protein